MQMNTQENQDTPRLLSPRPFVTDVSVADLLSPFQQEKHTEFINFLFTRRGQFMSVMWARPLKFRAKCGHNGMKMVRAVCRAGITYDNIAAVQEKRENGELPEVNQGLPWGEWYRYPYLIKNKDELYVRLYPSKIHQVKTDWFLDGAPSDRETVAPFCLASELRDIENLDTFTIKLNSVKETLEVA